MILILINNLLALINTESRVEGHNFLAVMYRLWQGFSDGAEGVADLGTEQAHHSNHDDRDESEDNRILDEALAFFFG